MDWYNSAGSRVCYNSCKLDWTLISSRMRSSHWVCSKHPFVCSCVHVRLDGWVYSAWDDDWKESERVPIGIIGCIGWVVRCRGTWVCLCLRGLVVWGMRLCLRWFVDGCKCVVRRMTCVFGARRKGLNFRWIRVMGSRCVGLFMRWVFRVWVILLCLWMVCMWFRLMGGSR